jgi:Zn-finger nucleic acid-binding protein
MKSKTEVEQGTEELQFELKYCERCGGLWLRPMGGGQVYCVGCAREMAKLPPASQHASIPGREERDGDDEEFEDYEESLDLDAMGGVA